MPMPPIEIPPTATHVDELIERIARIDMETATGDKEALSQEVRRYISRRELQRLYDAKRDQLADLDED